MPEPRCQSVPQPLPLVWVRLLLLRRVLFPLPRTPWPRKDAFDSNQDAVGALYSVMVALDAVSLALDVTSLAMDFVPGIGQAISVVLDLINLGIAGINIGLSFVVGLVIDNGQRHRDAWDAYLNSDAFKSYMNDLSDSFRKEGYDSLTVIVDSTSAGVPDYGTGDNLESWQKRTLTERARRLPDSKDLRLAILDQSLSGHTLMGRDNDDYIDGGKGKRYHLWSWRR